MTSKQPIENRQQVLRSNLIKIAEIILVVFRSLKFMLIKIKTREINCGNGKLMRDRSGRE
jgi:hypothetical protein